MSEDIAPSDWRLPDAPNVKFSRAYDLIRFLHSRAGKTQTHDAIWSAVYGAKPEAQQPETMTVKVFVCHLRKQLVGTPWQIISEHGVGYRLERKE